MAAEHADSIVIAARVPPKLAESFTAACKLDGGRTVSATMRMLMAAYCEAMTRPAQTATPEPLGGLRRQRDSLTATDDNNDRTEDDRVPSG
jgi:hypothetical protein